MFLGILLLIKQPYLQLHSNFEVTLTMSKFDI